MNRGKPLLLIARHGETGANREGRWQGRLDDDRCLLTEAGRAAAHRLAQLAEKHAVNALLTSPRRRAGQTAGPAGERLGLRPEIREELSECCYGRWEGLDREEIIAADRFLWDKREADKFNFVHPGVFTAGPGEEVIGESYAAVHRRLQPLWAELDERVRAGPILVIAHKGVLRSAARQFGGLEEAAAGDLTLEPDECFLADLSGERPRLDRLRF